MKKWILILFAFTCSNSIFSQVLFGVKAGVNLTDMSISGYTTATAGLKYKTDFTAGLVASFSLFSTFYLQPEVVYSGQGYKYMNGTRFYKSDCNYINVPVLFKFKHSTGLFAETGPQIGFLLSVTNNDPAALENSKSLFYNTDFSWAFGIGYQIPNINLGIDARYNLGLTNVENDNGGQTLKNSVFQFGLFYMLNIRN
jgi:Outer membrane protein beta-barrel domain